MPIYILSHTMDKVRYFRDLLTTDERRPQIIVGTTVKPLLDMAIADYKDVAVNQICVMYQWDASPKMAVKEGRINNKPPVLIFVRWVRDVFQEALQEEYPDCDVVYFEPDPIHAR